MSVKNVAASSSSMPPNGVKDNEFVQPRQRLASGLIFFHRWGFVLLAMASFCAFAQGGPPMVSDDPGTPGDGHYEINVAVLLDRTSSASSYEAPLIDFNYGLGDRLQLKLETPYAIDGAPHRSGVGNGLAGVKWRFFDDDDGWQVSTYPQVQFNYPGVDSDRRGLADRGTSYFLPVEAQRLVGPIELGFEVGRWIRPDDDSWTAGVVVGRQITERVELIAELHEERLIASSRGERLIDVGSRVKLSPHFNFLASVGRDLHNSIDEPADLLIYVGLQLVL
jgi:hypothetical protein